MSRYCLLLICFLCARTAFSQAAEYQGKRFFAEVGTSFWINVTNPRANNIGFERFPAYDRTASKFTLQEHYFLSLSYVLSRKTAFSLEYEYSKTGLHIREYLELLNPAVDVGVVTASRVIYGLIDRHQLFYQLYAHKTNFSFSHYFSTRVNVAPLGWYMKWGLDLVLAKGVLLDQKVNYGHDLDFNDNKPSEAFTNPTGIDANRLIPMSGIHWGIGYRNTIADRFIVHGALQTTVFSQIFNSYRDDLSQAGREERYEDRNNLNYLNRVYQRVQAHYFFNIVVGIGVLIY
ncbi:MAG: Unknown protein [uncultured Aureispira sp.]|uniref:Outer membrane protein beta-barrel domain-containing protein n=1 Tax=uncultured Aureispira sp. TaxID=1331704 RepID=A0A6S6UHG7_9BACT|nr:MAG: Unknown protein [uncultured Aureispira sp.]